MDKMRQLAMIMLVGLGIYMVWVFGLNLLGPLALAMSARTEMDYAGLIPLFLLTTGFLAAAIIFLIIQRKKWAEKIVACATVSEPQTKTDWLPFAFRLTVIGVGLMMVPRVIFKVTSLLQAAAIEKVGGISVSGGPSVGTFLDLALLTVLTTYLVCGAPHFVKWQVKKTLQQCSDAEHSE
jgi:hypothetical protein